MDKIIDKTYFVSNTITKQLKQIKKGGYFRLSPFGKTYVRDEYNRCTRCYMYHPYDNNNICKEAAGTKKVLPLIY